MTIIDSEEQLKEIKPEGGGKLKLCKKLRVLEAISVLKQLNNSFFETESKKRALLEESSESPIFLQVSLKKIPSKKARQIIKVPLPHPLVTDTTDVCLLTGDVDKINRKAEIDPDVEYYKELLKKQGVSKVTEVIPLRQLRTEYKVYETRRQLMAAYDIFLCDKKIAECLPRLLGKTFFKKRKFPIQINMESSNLKEQIENALSKTAFNLTCRGNSCSTEVARLGMEAQEILDNIRASIKVLAEKLPGQGENISGLYIKTARCKSIPIYLSFDDPSEVKLQKIYKKETVDAEELSTLPNAKVKVFKDGYVKVEKKPDSDDENSDELEQKKVSKKRKMDTEISETENNSDDKPSLKTKKLKISKKCIAQEDDTDADEVLEETNEVVVVKKKESVSNKKTKKEKEELLDGNNEMDAEKEKKERGKKRKLENERDEKELNRMETALKKKIKNKKNVEIDGGPNESIISSKILLENESGNEPNVVETTLKKKRTKNKKNVKANGDHNESVDASMIILRNENNDEELNVTETTLKKKRTKNKKNVKANGDNNENVDSFKVILRNENNDKEPTITETALTKKRTKHKKNVKADGDLNKKEDVSDILLRNENDDDKLNITETTLKKKTKNKKAVKSAVHDESIGALKYKKANKEPNKRKSFGGKKV